MGYIRKNNQELPHFRAYKPVQRPWVRRCLRKLLLAGYRPIFIVEMVIVAGLLLLILVKLCFYPNVTPFYQENHNGSKDLAPARSIDRLQLSNQVKTDLKSLSDFSYAETPLYTLPEIVGPFAVSEDLCYSSFDYGLVNRLVDGAYDYCQLGGRNASELDTSREFKCFRAERNYNTGSKTEHVTNMFCRVNGTGLARAKSLSPARMSYVVGCPAPYAPRTKLAVDRASSYMYETGLSPAMRFISYDRNNNVSPQKNIPTLGSPNAHTIFFKRDGPGNLYHFLNEALSLYVTRHVLALQGVSDVHLVIADNYDNGPFWNVWQSLGPGKTLSLSRIRNFTEETLVHNPVWALSGGDGPFWKCNWPRIPCGESALIKDFRANMMSAFSLDVKPEERRALAFNIVIIGRRGAREIQNLSSLIKTLSSSLLLPLKIPLDIQEVFFERLSMREQVKVASNADILLAVHGAGLGHAIWMEKGSALIELYPYQFKKFGFANLAQLIGVKHFPLSTDKVPGQDYRDYHAVAVKVEPLKFLHAVQAAVNHVLQQKFIAQPSVY